MIYEAFFNQYMTTKKNIILMIGPVPKAYLAWVLEQKKNGDTRRYYNLQSKRQLKEEITDCERDLDGVFQCSF